MTITYNALFCPYTQVADGNHNCNIKDVKEGEGNSLIELDLQRSKKPSHMTTYILSHDIVTRQTYVSVVCHTYHQCYHTHVRQDISNEVNFV